MHPRRLRVALVYSLSLIALGLAQSLQAQTPPAMITLAMPAPAIAQPGVTVVTLVASGIPAGTITAANLSVTLQVASGATGPALTAQVSGYSAIPGNGGRLTFQVLGPNVAAPTPYSVSVSGKTSTGITFASGKPAALTINPPAQILSINPSSAQPGQTVQVSITGQYTNYLQGSTTASFGSGVSVGGAALGQLGPVTVTSPTTAVAQLNIDASAAAGPRAVTVATGIQQATLPSGFSVTAPPSLLSVSPNSGQQGQTGLSITITGQFTHFAQGTSAVSFGSDITVNSVTAASATSLTANVTIPSNANLGGHTVSVITGSEVATLANGFTVGAPSNQAPVVSAGSNQTITLPNSAALSGSVSDDGLPFGATLTATWSLLSAPVSTGGQFWLKLAATGTLPSQRNESSVVFDPVTDRLIVFGGLSVNSGTNGENDVWVLTGANGLNANPSWTQLHPTGAAPGPRYGHGGFYDPTSNRMVIFGGAGSGQFFNDLWVLTNANGTGGTPAWIQLSPSGTAPAPRRYMGLAYDSANNRMMIFGGQSGAPSWLNETWILTNANGTGATSPAWLQLAPAGTLPHARSNPVVAYDPGSNRLIAFSGQFSVVNSVVAEEFNDAWVLTNANGLGAAPTWIPLTPDGAATSPNQRFEGIAAYNPTLNVITIAGGIGNCVGVDQCSAFSDVWSLSNANGLGGASTWSQRTPSGGPPAPLGYAAYDSVDDRLISFGGGGSYTLPIIFYNDTWILTNATGSDPGGAPGTVNFSSPTFSTPDSPGQLFPVVTNAAFSIPGNYVLRLTGSDSQLTSTSNTTVTVQPPSGTPVLGAAVPNAGQQGQSTLAVTITGQNTQFIQGTTQVSFGAGVSVTSVTVIDVMHVAAVVNIAANAALGFQNVTVTTGAQALTLANGFTVLAGAPALTQINPNSGQQGQQNLQVNITGQFTHWLQSATTATFGAGITVASLTVNSATSAVALLNIDPAAAAGARTVTLATGTEVAALNNGFMVNSGTLVPNILNLIPSQANADIAASNLTVGSVTDVYQPLTLNFNTLPSNQGFDYFLGGAYSGSGIPESQIFSLSGGVLQINSMGVYLCGGGDIMYTRNGIVDSGTPFSISFTARVLEEEGNVQSNSYGFFVAVTTGREDFGIGLGTHRIEATGAPPYPFTTSIDNTVWHNYRLNGQPGVGLQIYVDNVLVLSDAPDPDYQKSYSGPTGSSLSFGKGTCGTNALAQMTALSFQQSPGFITSQAPVGGTLAIPQSPVAYTALFQPHSRPAVNAGPNLSVAFGTAANLAGTVFDDGQAGPSLSVDWSKVAGPGSVTFAPPHAAQSSASFSAPGVYVLKLTAADLQYSNSDVVTVTVTPTQGTPQLISVTPGAANEGARLSLTITGQSTHFVQAITHVSFDFGVTVNSFIVNSPTQLLAQVSVDPDAILGPQTVVVTTGTEIVALEGGLNIQLVSSPQLTVTPNSGQQGQILSSEIVWAGGNITSGAIASFGPSISVGGGPSGTAGPVTVLASGGATGNLVIDPAATPGPRDVVLTSGEQTVTLTGGFIVLSSAAITSVVPNVGQPSQTLSLAITGQNTHFVQGVTTVSLGLGIAVGAVTVANSTSLTVQITISPIASLATQSLIVTTGSEIVLLTKAFSVTTAAPTIVTVSPNSGPQGQGGPVGIVGLNTHFAQGTTQVSFGPGVTVSNIVVTCPTCLTAQLQIAATAVLGPVTVTVTTGSEVATLTGGFTVLPGTPILTSMVPATGSQGQTLTSTVTGLFTHWVQGTTQVNLGAGITVTSVIVSSVTSLKVQLSIDPAAAVGVRALTVTTGAEVVSAPNVFTVQAAGPALYSLNPGSGTQGQQNLSVMITGLATHFAQGTSKATFGAGVTVTSLTVASATSATATVNIDPAAIPGTRTVTITTGSETASFTNGFTVSLSPPIVYTLDPGGSSQGATGLQVQITGLNTHFAKGTSVATFGAGITVTSFAVTNATTATATINIDVAATLGTRTVTVTTGTEVASFVNGFTVVAGVPGITQINPSSGAQGIQSLMLTVTAQFTHFVQGITTAMISGGVIVSGATVSDATHLSLSISIPLSAATGSRTLTVTTGTEVVSAPFGFSVTASTPSIVSINPTHATQGQQNVNVTIAGQLTNFVQGTSSVSFGGAGLTVNSVTVASATSLTANISLALSATPGARTVAVTTGSEVDSLANAFTVQPAGNQPPVISIDSTWSVVLPNALTLNYTVSDPGLAQGGTLTVSWSTVSGPATVGFLNQTPTSIVANFTLAGTYVLQVGATDSFTQLTSTQNVTVNVTGTLPAPPTVSITSPTDGSSITTLTNVMGSVASPALASWSLEFHMQNESFFRPISTGTTAVTNAILGTFDPTLLLNGLAIIQLRATDTAGQTTTFGPISVVVMGNQKVGNFTVSFNDLSVPVAGLPIQVVRTYDSRNKTAGDFGVGWRLDLTTVSLATNGPLGNNWVGTNSGGLFANYCIDPSSSHVVTITFADGTVFQFQPTLAPACQQLAPLSQTSVTFAPISTTPPNASLAIVGSNLTFIDGSFPGTITLLDLDDVTTFDPDLYQLTMPDGRVLRISQSSGLQSMTDPNGNKLIVSASGITHSSGKSVSFLRDQTGRITQITDPMGNKILYGYDTSNDLTGVTDAAGNTSTFTYDANHGLLTIVDPAGVQPIKNVYDSSGRLIQHIDAFGKTINYTNNLAGQQEIVTDRLGNVTANYYDANGNIVQVTDALGGNTKRTYDANNNLLTETNPLSETRTYTYDANNNRLTETDPLGQKTTYTYNSRNQVLAITDPLGHVTTNVYDANGNLLSTKDPAGNTTTYGYNSAGLRTSMTDALGDVTGYQYDASGNLTQQTDAVGHVTTYAYDANGNKLSQTQTRTTSSGPQTMVTSYQYDADNRLTKMIYPDGSSTQTAYNAIGKQGVTTDQLSRQTSYQYDLMGRLIQTTYADGTNESSAYDAEGDRITSTDRAGRSTSYLYDSLKRLVQTTYADSAKTGTTYDAAGEVTVVTDARGNATKYQYDAAGRRTAVVDAQGHSTGFAYDVDGNQASMTDANGHTSQYQYDADNRRTKVVYPDATADSTAYDALGRTVTKTDQAGRITQYGYDKLERLIQVTDALSQITAYTYDEVGDRLTQTDANGHSTAFAYDNLGRRILRTLPLGMSETSTYDLAGNLHSKTDFNGKTTSYGYDALNRLLTKTPDASLGQTAVHYTYSATGQRLSMIDASGTTTYSYDLRDRLLQKATPEGTLTYTYDAAGNLLSIRSSNTGGISVNYVYDTLNRLSTVTDNRLASGTTAYAYDNAGNLQSYLYPNGVQSLYAYDALNRLTNLTLSKGSTIASYGYTLGAAGNRTAVVELGGRQVNYTYDALYRLTAETIAGGSVNGAIGYTYDPVGNRLTRTSTVGPVPAATSTYDANDRLNSDTYDANGNTTASGGNTDAYDFENHLSSQNGGAVSIIYDGDGNRVSKTAGAATTKYLIDDRNLTGYAQVLEESVGGAVQRVYTYGLNRISQSQASGTSFYGYDGHGNVRLLTDATGVVTDRYDYDAFGDIISQAGTTPNVYLYSGEQNDPNLGFYYLRARYLSQATGRFWTGDSYEGNPFDPLSLHRYSYAAQNPVTNRDPSGQQLTTVELLVVSSIIGYTAYLGVQGLTGDLEKAKTAGFAATLAAALFLAPQVALPASGVLQLGNIGLSQGGLSHITDFHSVFGRFASAITNLEIGELFTKSVFSPGEDLVGLVRYANTVTPYTQGNGNLAYVVYLTRAVGYDIVTNAPIYFYTVIVNPVTRLVVTAFPGAPRNLMP